MWHFLTLVPERAERAWGAVGRYYARITKSAYQWLRRTPMPAMAMAVGLFCGLLVWVVLDPMQSQALQRALGAELHSQLNLRAHEALVRFEAYLRNYEATAHLLAHQQRMIDCLMRRGWDAAPEGEPLIYSKGTQPSWLPDTSFWTSLVRPSHVALFDERERLREVYQLVDRPWPRGVEEQAPFFLSAGDVDSFLTILDGRVYLLVSEPVHDGHGETTGILMLAVPVDAEFLQASQQGVLFPDAVLAIVDGDEHRILATSEERTVAPQTTLESWENLYLITSQSFFDYEGTDLNLQFATLIPANALEESTKRALSLERRQRIVAAAVFIGVFTLAIFLVSVHLNAVLRRLSMFSQRALGFTDPPITGGNQLVLLEEWIARFARLVMEARSEMRQRHQSEIRETQALKTAVMETVRDCVFTMESDGRILELNSTAERVFGVTRSEVIGRNLTKLLLTPDSAGRFRDLVRASSESPAAAAEGVGDELVAKHRDGSPFPVEVTVMPTRLKSRAVHTVYLQDISKRRRVEKEMESLAKFTSESPSPVLRVNGKGVILYANAASDPLLEYWNCRRGQTLPVFWRDRVREVLAHDRQEEQELESGRRIYSLLLAPVVSFDYVNIFGRDTTEVRRAEQQARQHQAELVHVCRLSTMGEMSTGMAHELNQPLSAISNFARGGIRRLEGSRGRSKQDLASAFEQIAVQAERAGEIIKRLRSMVTRQQTIRAVVDLNALAREVASFVEYEARKLGIEIEFRLSRGRLNTRVDLVQIEQVVLNLVRNALDALAEVPQDQRRLQIRTARFQQDRIGVSVHDTGPGIGPEAKEKLFDAFYTTKSSGMGMGLPISKTIAEDHKGSIRVWSRVGRGTTFTLVLPAHIATAGRQST